MRKEENTLNIWYELKTPKRVATKDYWDMCERSIPLNDSLKGMEPSRN